MVLRRSLLQTDTASLLETFGSFNIKLVFNSFKIKHYFSYKDPIPDEIPKPFLLYTFTCAILAKLVVILKLGLRNISKRKPSLIFLNIYTPLQHALTHIILFVLE